MSSKLFRLWLEEAMGKPSPSRYVQEHPDTQPVKQTNKSMAKGQVEVEVEAGVHHYWVGSDNDRREIIPIHRVARVVYEEWQDARGEELSVREFKDRFNNLYIGAKLADLDWLVKAIRDLGDEARPAKEDTEASQTALWFENFAYGGTAITIRKANQPNQRPAAEHLNSQAGKRVGVQTKSGIEKKVASGKSGKPGDGYRFQKTISKPAMQSRRKQVVKRVRKEEYIVSEGKQVIVNGNTTATITKHIHPDNNKFHYIRSSKAEVQPDSTIKETVEVDCTYDI